MSQYANRPCSKRFSKKKNPTAWLLSDLRQHAKDLKLQKYSRLRKDELCNLLNAATQNPPKNKKTTQRPSPNSLAKDHKGLLKKGNDGLMWKSTCDKNGKYSWRKSKKKTSVIKSGNTLSFIENAIYELNIGTRKTLGLFLYSKFLFDTPDGHNVDIREELFESTIGEKTSADMVIGKKYQYLISPQTLTLVGVEYAFASPARFTFVFTQTASGLVWTDNETLKIKIKLIDAQPHDFMKWRENIVLDTEDTHESFFL